MATVVPVSDAVIVPGWVTDLDSFHRWLDADPLPERARVWFLRGRVWVDMTMEQVYTHVEVKTEITTVLRVLSRAEKLGRVLGDGARLVNRDGDLSGEPDMLFLAAGTIAAERVVHVGGKATGVVALEGSPDMVLEVVSDSSVTKDTATLLDAYFAAGIREYWLVDARGSGVEFTIHARGPDGYVGAGETDGWVASAVFGKSFRLVRGVDPDGNPEFTLEVR